MYSSSFSETFKKEIGCIALALARPLSFYILEL